MHYSFNNKLSKETAFYVVATILIIGFFLLGIAGRSNTKNQSNVQPTNVANTASAAPQKSKEISVYDHDANEVLYMDIEDYVVGVLSKEMPASFNMEALKAQAIAARTIAYKHTNKHSGCNNCDVCTSPGHVQGYASIEDRKLLWGNEYDKWKEIIESAVFETKGEVLTFDGELIDVLYHASSNGQTENSVNVFSESRQYLVSVSSPDENLVKDELIISKKDFADEVNKVYPNANLLADNLMNQVRISSHTQSGRVEIVALGDIAMDGVSFRQLFSIKSTNFSFVFIEDEVIISTLGYGHGVGMSQRGANEMAKQGYSYVDILTHYYTGANVVNHKIN